MIGLFLKTTIGLIFIGVISFLGWQLYVYQTIDPTLPTADSCTELFCQPGTQCIELKKNNEDFSKDIKAPVYKCQSFVGAVFQGSFLTRGSQ